MPTIILGLFLLYLILFGIKQFSRVTPAQAARILKPGGGVLMVLLTLLRGRAGGGLGLLISLLLTLLGSRGNFGSMFTAAGGRQPPRTSTMRSAMVEMRLDHGTGALEGTVLSGPLQGQPLDALTRPACLGLYRTCLSDDPEGARLLEAYLDRRFAGWRDADEGDGQARRDGRASVMSEDEAHEILGLAKGAGPEEITRAHRSLMKKLHPDAGGTTSLAARVNEARDVLMRGH
jgi:hypothetical protein